MDAAFGKRIPYFPNFPIRRFRSPGDVERYDPHTSQMVNSEVHRAIGATSAAARIDHVVPLASERVMGSQAKRFLRTAMGFYMRYVAQQVSDFGARATYALELLALGQDELAEAKKHEQAWLAIVTETPVTLPADVIAAVAAELEGVRGRAMALDAPTVEMIDALESVGLDASGIVATAASTPTMPDELGRDIRHSDSTDALDALGERTLGAVVLCGFVDTATTQRRLLMLRSALVATKPGGKVVVAATKKSSWSQTVEPLVTDLAPGRPFGPGTWSAVLERNGCENVREHNVGDHHTLIVGEVGISTAGATATPNLEPKRLMRLYS